MLSKGYLAGTSTYTCIDHTDEIIDCYFSLLDPIFKLIKDCEEGLDINKVLKGPVCHSGFKRLN
jgi:glutamate-1-semialdehyde 2,1-aminomutase